MPTSKLMGILNTTPNSFHDGGFHNTLDTALSHALQMIDEGADIIDIGGESTRPGADPVTVEEELSRTIPVIKALHAARPSTQISIDTVKHTVARAAVEAGATLINDVTGFRDPQMRALAAETRVSVCVMHMQGKPKTMQKEIAYDRPVLDTVFDFLKEQTALLLDEGVNADKIIIDPGFGFGKTIDHNFEILQNLHIFKGLGFPLLLGLSRKSTIQRVLQKESKDCLYGTVALNTVGALHGADILRVHDVEPHRDLLLLLGSLQGVKPIE